MGKERNHINSKEIRPKIQKTKFKTRDMKNELKALYKLTSKLIRNDYIDYRKTTLQRHLKQTHSTWIDGLDNLGKTFLNRNDIIKIAIYSNTSKQHSLSVSKLTR